MTSEPLDLERDVPLAPFTTFGIGGPADYLCRPRTANELVKAVTWAREEQTPFFFLGLGANILVGDKGYRGLVIKNEATKAVIEGDRLVAESGAVVNDLIEQTAAAGLSGLEHYQNIPSTVGGALWQNLHFLSYPHDRTYFIAEIVVGARVLEQDGTIHQVDADYFKFGYDDSVLHRNRAIVLEATFQLAAAPKTEIELRRQKNAEWRLAKHPKNSIHCSAGSIFQKIEGVGAGRLIDGAGLKGYQIGGAQVAERHANYIINVDHATAADVRALISHVQQTVETDSGYFLEPEISFVGEF